VNVPVQDRCKDVEICEKYFDRVVDALTRPLADEAKAQSKNNPALSFKVTADSYDMAVDAVTNYSWKSG
jgi:hypothetical protein